ncbi:MAG TPA: type VI secretion system membrane subunit TssM [Steroidobacteraceae bacterium]|nr:type VI secretion system membrane subunit TssM [Steroidobacteraceae bacterium]
MIALLKKLLLLIALLLIAGVIWFGGPYLAFADYVPLETPLARLILIGLVVVLWGVRAAWRALKAARAGGQLAKAVARQEDPTSARVSAEARQLQQRFEEAAEALRRTRKGSTSLYELPWYIIIGPPGAGKTTAIVNSGLNFPLAQKFGKEALRGVGGTRNCDWWFTDQAILLDTAGRYTTQDSDQAGDAAGWREFLGLLRKYRRRRPINGVLVAMSVADLASLSDAERTRHVAAVRERLEELHRELRITLPVYLLLTKCDLLAGFTEFFDDLDQEARAQVWGTTFPIADSRSGAAPAQLSAQLDELLERLNTRMLGRLEAERDVERRALIFGFPRQFAGLRRALTGFVEEAFGPSAFEQGAWLRGVYLTSGTQEGTPIDRMLGALSRTFGLGVRAVGAQGGQGKAYFIRRLLTEVIFHESGLAGLNRRVEIRTAFVQSSAYLGIAAATVLICAAFLLSYERNSSYLRDVQAVVQPLANLPPADTGGLTSVLPRLDAYRDVLAVADRYHAGAPLSMRAGLYQGGSLAGAALDAYLRELNDGLSPALAAAFQDRISQLASQPDRLYEYLKTYLMLGEPQRLVPAEMQFMSNLEWRQRFAGDPATVERLDTHVNALIADKSRVQPVSLNEDLVAQARTSLRQASLPVLMYSRLKLSSASDTQHAIHLDKEIGLGGDSVLIRKSGTPLSEPVPALYTQPVFQDVATTGKYTIANDFVGDSWVLGEGVASRTDIPRLVNDMMRLYEDDYIRTWDALLADLAPRPTTSAKDLADMMALLASASSPLKRLLTVVEANTNLLKPPPAGDAAASVKAAIAAKLQTLQQTFGAVPTAEPPGTRVTQHFQALHKLIDGPPGAAPIDQTLQAIGQIQKQLGGMGNGLGDTNALSTVASAGQATAVQQLRIAAMQLPAPIAAIVAQVGSKGEAVAKAEAGQELSRLYQTDVAGECRQLIEGRYPFAAGAKSDVTLADFGRLFASGGVFDLFFHDHLAPLVDTSTTPWRWKEGAGGIGPASLLSQFQAVERIRQIYFKPGAQLPELHFSVTPEYLDAPVRRLVLDIDGQDVEYRHGPTRAQALVWPGPAPGQSSVLFEESGGAGPNRSYQGPWALFHLLDEASVQPQSDVRYLVTVTASGRTARVTLEATSVRNPFGRAELRGFRCGT